MTGDQPTVTTGCLTPDGELATDRPPGMASSTRRYITPNQRDSLAVTTNTAAAGP